MILTTPVVRRLRLENPGAEIGVQTAYPDVFRNSPHKVATLDPGNLPYPWTERGGCDRTMDLDLVYERQPRTHIVQAYMEAAFGLLNAGLPATWQQEISYDPPAAMPKGVVAVHAARTGWRNRTLPAATWFAVTVLLRREGWFPLLVGGSHETVPEARAASALGASLHAQVAMISRCAAFIGSDSALLHAAGATDVPIVGVFTSVRPEVRLPWRRGQLGWNCEAVMPLLECVGCHADQPVPSTTESCARGDLACVKTVQAEDIVAALERLMRPQSIVK